MRNEKRYQDIDEVLDAGIDVISTVNVQHLESLNDAIAELTDVRVRETFPDRILEEADEVVLVDISPQALQERLRAGKVYAPERADVALQNFFRSDRLSALRELALREVAEDVEARRQATRARPAEPARRLRNACSRSSRRSRGRSGCCGAPGARPSGSARSSTRCGCASPASELSEEEQVSLAALRRLAIVLGAHFLEEEGDDLVATVRRVVYERGTTYVFVGTPDESRRREVLRGSLVSALVRELPGVDIRVVANRADRPEAAQ